MDRTHLQIDLSQVRHCDCVAPVGSQLEVLQRLLVVQVDSSSPLVVQLAQTHLRLHVPLVRQQLIELDQVVVQDASAQNTVAILHLVQQSNPVNGRATAERHLLNDVIRNLLVKLQTQLAVGLDGDAGPVAIRHYHLGENVYVWTGLVRNDGHGEVQESLRLADILAYSDTVHEPQGDVAHVDCIGDLSVRFGGEEREETEVGLGPGMSSFSCRF